MDAAPVEAQASAQTQNKTEEALSRDPRIAMGKRLSPWNRKSQLESTGTEIRSLVRDERQTARDCDSHPSRGASIEKQTSKLFHGTPLDLGRHRMRTGFLLTLHTFTDVETVDREESGGVDNFS